MFDAHRSFAGVVKSRCKLGARIIRIRACHTRRQRWGRLWSEWILIFIVCVFFFLGVFCVLLGGVRRLLRLFLWRSREGRCLRLRSVYSETRNNRNTRHTQSKTAQLVHRFSSRVSFFNMVSMIRISARCVLSASVAKLNNSASWPAPAASNKSFTMVNAPL